MVLIVAELQSVRGLSLSGKLFMNAMNELRSVLEGWLIVKIRYGDRLPVMVRLASNQVSRERY